MRKNTLSCGGNIMYEVSEGKIEVKADYEVIECFILSGSPFDDRHLLGWKRLISFQD